MSINPTPPGAFTATSTFAEKIRNIIVAIIAVITLFGFMMVPVSYYARAEMKNYVTDYFDLKVEAGYKTFRKEQRQWNRDFERKFDRYNYDFGRRLDLFEERQKNRDNEILRELRRGNERRNHPPQ